MTSKDVKRIEKYIRDNDKRRVIRYAFLCEHRSKGIFSKTVMVYVFHCFGPILGYMDDAKEAKELIDTCLGIQ
jgi:hypothetical protein